MVSGIREKDEALQLAGVDYLVLGNTVLSSLSDTATMAGCALLLLVHAGCASPSSAPPRLCARRRRTTQAPGQGRGAGGCRYNDGFTAASEVDVVAALGADQVDAGHFTEQDTQTVTEDGFRVRLQPLQAGAGAAHASAIE